MADTGSWAGRAIPRGSFKFFLQIPFMISFLYNTEPVCISAGGDRCCNNFFQKK